MLSSPQLHLPSDPKYAQLTAVMHDIDAERSKLCSNIRALLGRVMPSATPPASDDALYEYVRRTVTTDVGRLRRGGSSQARGAVSQMLQELKDVNDRLKDVRNLAYEQRAKIVYNFQDQRNKHSDLIKQLNSMAYDPPGRLPNGGHGYQQARNNFG
jgi:hypothetical protein